MYKFFKMTALCAALAAAGAAGAATITLDGTSLSIEDAWKIAAGEADVAIAPEAVKLLEDSHKLVMASAAKGQAVYGLTVGVGLDKDREALHRRRQVLPRSARSLPRVQRQRPCARTPPASVK